jgi:hypothetical protein
LDDDPSEAQRRALFTPEECDGLLALLDARLLRQHKQARAAARDAEAAAIIEDAITQRYGAVTDTDWTVLHGLAVQLSVLRDAVEARFGAAVVRELLRVLSRGRQGPGRPREVRNKAYQPSDPKEAERLRRRRQHQKEARKASADRVRRKLAPDDPVKY